MKYEQRYWCRCWHWPWPCKKVHQTTTSSVVSLFSLEGPTNERMTATRAGNTVSLSLAVLRATPPYRLTSTAVSYYYNVRWEYYAMNDTFMKYLPAMSKSLSNWLDAPSPGVSMQIEIPHTYNMAPPRQNIFIVQGTMCANVCLGVPAKRIRLCRCTLFRCLALAIADRIEYTHFDKHGRVKMGQYQNFETL